VALFERVLHFLHGALALYKLGNIQRDAEVDITHHALVVVVPVFLGGGCLVNVRLILDISIGVSDSSRNIQVCLGKDLVATFKYDIGVYGFRP
jgi:hypothetical protein